MPPELTPTRRAVLTATLHLGVQATLDNVAQRVGVTRQAVSYQAGILRELGYLETSEGRYGLLILTPHALLTLGQGIPIYGQIAAGPPALAEQSPDESTPSLEALLGFKPGDFLLKIKGESMTGIGVLDGDYVIVRPAEEVHDGEVAVVLIPGENAATLKRLYHLGTEVILVSENPATPRLSFPGDQVQVQGRMVGRVGVGVPRVTARWEDRIRSSEVESK